MPELRYIGVFGFGTIIGWFVYYVNRYRQEEVKLSDVGTLIGIIGGAAVTALHGRGRPQPRMPAVGTLRRRWHIH